MLVTIESVQIPADRRPVVIFSATDERGEIVGLHEITEARFILAYLQSPGPGSTPRYVSYVTRIEDPDATPGSGDEAVQATYDAAGLLGLTQKDNGKFRYKFATALPANYNPDASHQIGGQFRRVFGANGVTYRANAVLPFLPSGGKVLETRDIVETETCNRCHTRLSEHGDIRREVQLCIMCHTPQSTDAQSGNTVDFPVMIHKIHRGADLPSVLDGEPYQIVGFGGVVHDYSTVEFPQPVQNCEVCHAPEKQNFHLEHPTMAGCASCHDRTWFAVDQPTPPGYENHPIGIPVNDDSLCSACHRPTAPGVAPIFEAHLLPTETDAAPGLVLDITGVTILTGGPAPQLRIDFTAFDGDGMPITALTEPGMTVASTFAWPALEYEQWVRETITGTPPGSLVNNGGGSYTYTFAGTLPAGSTDTFAVAMEGRRRFTLEGVNYNQGTATNGLTYFTLEGVVSKVIPPQFRRDVVDESRCTVCHGEIRMHGENRVGVDYCIMCHNPNQTDEARRPAGEMPPVTVNFKDMLHHIHTGEDLTGEYTVYGFGNVAHDFTEVRFPARRENCQTCHLPGTFGVPLPPEALSTVVTQAGQFVSEVLPARAACTGCHDDAFTNAHALINTDPNTGVESCSVCHGSGADFDVETVHTLGP